MAKIGVRNLNEIYRTSYPTGQAFDDVIAHISNLKTQVETLQALVKELQKKTA